jgi:CubicO group peptidase (beta-lactamase class C family)
MRRHLALLLVLTLAPAALARSRAVTHRPNVELPAVDAIAAKALATGIPGLTIAVRKGKSFFVNGYGVSDRERALPAERHSEYQVGSITKQFATAAVMRLAEEGKLRVDDRARRWLPELDARFDAITIEHLMTHTSGVIAYEAQLTSPYEPKTQQEILALITSSPPQFPPGGYFEYSNSGYFLLGMILERAAAKPFDQLVRDLFFTPLSLHGTSYCGTNGPAPDGYSIDEKNTVYPMPAADMSIVFAAGAICSTANDLLRWTDALANGVAVSRQSYERMITSYRPSLMRPVGYGYGLLIDRLDGRRRISHGGEILGFESNAASFPDDDLTIVVLVNLIDFETDRAALIAEEIARALR